MIALLAAAVLLFSLCACNQKADGNNGGDATESEGAPNEETTVHSGNALPDFTVYSMEGEEVTLYEKFGKPLVVNFWATWCPPCKAEMPDFEKVYGEMGSSVEFMMINMTDGSRDTEASVKAFIEDNGYTFPVYLDSKMSAMYTYSVQSIPMTLFFSADGELVDYNVGAMSEQELIEKIGKIK